MEKLPEIYISTRIDWRDWLAENHASSPGLWLIYYKKHTGVSRVAYEDAVEEALCFGWIDSTVRRLDNQRYCQMFVPRRKKSGWSGHNRRRAEALIKSGAMTAAGMAKIEDARANGAWGKALEDRVDRPVPPELHVELLDSPSIWMKHTRVLDAGRPCVSSRMTATESRRASRITTGSETSYMSETAPYPEDHP